MSTPNKAILETARWQVYRRLSASLDEHLRQIRNFSPSDLKPDFATSLHDPMLLPDMEIAVDLIQKAKKSHWPVVIFGDYDADGTPAAALLTLVFRRLDIKHQVILPTRAEGYGLKAETIDSLPAETKLLITVDTGITSVDEINLAKKRGMAVIVLDHHLPKSELPPADALVDLFLVTSTYPFPYLCGCALAYKLTVALQKHYPDQLSEGFVKWLLDLVAISTVADMMPLVGENRVLVHYGLKVLSKTRRLGLRALLVNAGIDGGGLTAGNVGYSIGPRLNASGRLSDNRPAYELLITEDQTEANRLATQIEQANQDRQRLVERILKEAGNILFEQNDLSDRCFVLKGDDWPGGVLGLVAGKLAGRYYRPVIVTSVRGDEISGSARSPLDYSIIDGLTEAGRYLDRFGGHKQAAGLTMSAANWPKFVDVIKGHAKASLDPADLLRSYQADAILEESELTLSTAELCEQFQPFGLENPTPIFIVEGVELGQPRPLGSGEHLRFNARKNQLPLEVIGFNLRQRYEANPLTKAHLLGHLESNRWQGTTRLQLRLVDFQATDSQIEVLDGKK